MSRCEECGNEIDVKLFGHGHRAEPTPCGRFTFDVNPDFIDFVKSQPPDISTSQLLDGWLEKLRAKP